MTDGPSRVEIRRRLRDVIDPCSAARGLDHDIVEMGLLDEVEIDGRDVTVRLRLTTPACLMVTNFAEQLEEHVGSMATVDSVELETDGGHHWRPHMMSEQARAQRDEYLHGLQRRYGSGA